MNANPKNELVSLEEHTDVVHEGEELLEVGSVTAETKGSIAGFSHDGGIGYTFG